MNNDLISREALKKAFYNQECWNVVIEHIIDNAPTVEYPFYAEAYQTGYEEGKADRPKGEWIEVDNGLVSGRCSLCGWEAVIMETDVCGMPFCPNCGADMKGGEGE